MAWMLSAPVVMAWTLSATTMIQPAIDDASTTSDAEATEAATETTSDTTAEAEGTWGSGAMVSEVAADDGFESTEESGSTTGSISATTATTTTTSTTHSDLEPISDAPPPAPSSKIDGFKGRIGVGAIRTIAGLNGINMRYFLTDKFAIGGSAGVALFTYGENEPTSTDPQCPDPMCNLENNRTVAFMAFNIEGLYFLRLGREAGQLPFRADLGLGGRFGVMTSSNNSDVEDNLDDPTELHIEIPLVFQLMFGNNFALSPELGMDFRIIPGSREDGDSNDGVYGPGELQLLGASDGPGFGWDLTPGVGLFGGASMHYYF